MKPNPIITLALVTGITSTAFAGFNAPLQEFKTPKQLAEWRAEMAAKSEPKTTATQDTAFYTGKPYLASSGNYAFKFRSYNPELARWTSEDPSGFPDEANNTLYSNSPISGIDPNGLKWGNADFIWHYYFGSGHMVTLSAIGLLDDVKDLAEMGPAGGAYRFGKQIERTAVAITKPYTGTFTDSFLNSYSFKSVSFSLGSSVLSGSYNGYMISTSNPTGTSGGSYNYNGNGPISFSDDFTDPLTLIEYLYGSSTSPTAPAWLAAAANIGGTPFHIEGNWTGYYSGSGTYE
jgi:RHS repeat-associated protein